MHARIITLCALALALSLLGCAREGTTGSSDKGSGGAPTLTKATLPTAIGTKWTVARRDVDKAPFTLDVKGPWKIVAGADWHTETNEIVDPKSVPGIEKFSGYTYVQRNTSDESGVYYYPRKVTDDWVFGLGRIHVNGGVVKTEPNDPGRFWPLQLEVGQDYEVSAAAPVRRATVLTRNTAETPAGTIKDAYLVRFRSEAAEAGGQPRDVYYLFAPNVGMVAYFSKLTGNEEQGFTEAGTVVVMTSLPAK